MATGKDLAAEAADLCDLLSEDNLTQLDFDELRRWLLCASQLLTEYETLHQERQLLRDDYQARIAGMLKAIAVASRSISSGRRSEIRCAISSSTNSSTTSSSVNHHPATSRNTFSADSLTELIDSLQTMSADELTRCYRKTAACFRDHFPGSFALPISKRA